MRIHGDASEHSDIVGTAHLFSIDATSGKAEEVLGMYQTWFGAQSGGAQMERCWFRRMTARSRLCRGRAASGEQSQRLTARLGGNGLFLHAVNGGLNVVGELDGPLLPPKLILYRLEQGAHLGHQLSAQVMTKTLGNGGTDCGLSSFYAHLSLL